MQSDEFNIDDVMSLAKNETNTKHERLDTLIHQVFKQNEQGRELISLWTESLIMKPIANPGDDMVSIGIEEGKRSFIRGILNTIKKVESRK